MTDPQNVADAADVAEAVECVQTYLDGVDRVAKAHGGQDYVFDAEDIVLHDAMRTLLADRTRMAAELEQVRELLGAAWLYVNWYSVTRQLTTEQRELWSDAVDAFAGPGMVGPGEPLPIVAVRWWRKATVTSPADATPDATGDTQTAERRANGQRDLTKLEGPQRGSQGDGGV